MTCVSCQVIPSAEVVSQYPRWGDELRDLLDCDRLLRPSGALAAYPEVGDTLGPFLLLAELGRGAAGRTYLATDPTLALWPVIYMFPLGLAAFLVPPEHRAGSGWLMLALIEQHVEYTNSPRGQWVVENWEAMRAKFIKVFPHEYKRVLGVPQANAQTAMAANSRSWCAHTSKATALAGC